jgi:crotonobetainyl-CoA:carnitine CoA-transferase CaiB-like acyl-CoA transferase
VNSFEDLMSDPQAQACGAFIDMPAIGEGTVQKTLATPVDFSATPVAAPKASPALGGDTDAVLGELGLGADDVARLREAKVIV